MSTISAKKGKKKKKSSSGSISAKRVTKASVNKQNKKPRSPKKSTAKRSKRSTSSNKPRVSLEPLRKELDVLVQQANTRVSQLLEQGLPSRALLEAQRTLKNMPTRVDDVELFKADLKSRKQINREFARVQEFLNDFTSTIKGAKNLQTDFDRFSGSWYTGEGMNQDLRGKTFEIYRKVLEAAGGWERAVGILKGKESLIGYGSENLVNNIYDMLENNYAEGDIISIALEQIESGLKAYEDMASRQVSGYNYGIVFDDDTVQARRDFYMWRSRFRKEYKNNVGGV